MSTRITTSNRFGIFVEKTAAQIHKLATAAEHRSAQLLEKRTRRLMERALINKTPAEPRFTISQKRAQGDGTTAPANSLASSFVEKK